MFNMTSAKNPAQMKILVLGLPRTGTQSLAGALKLLGYEKVYHMKDNFVRGDHAFWSQAMDAKFAGQGKSVDREAFDQLFAGEYMAVSDYPAAMFPDELITSYPSAKVILLSRDQDAWIKSMESTLLHAWNLEKEKDKKDKKMKIQTQTKVENEIEAKVISPRLLRNEMVQKMQSYGWNDDFEVNGPELFQKHNEHVRQLMKSRPGDFLELNVADGWESLCRFLGKEIPNEGFPRNDDWAKYKEDVKRSVAHY
ncbi:P-loop containing nucleoside triphosphate hydrolase protein [Penicillium verhagenii]|uniref:P-loop containing nucleoside triphosphate hydrolase protein n=1 Tax=Penicillium verhagenii TaxID=1562060 RepID=UPI002545544D|nr:P-loop containing nucleoside triphosphate hydrolase protein [Penicillium verhagenii]KAJ5935820.1 P-loop containing nucleoside triphosphate hydrolase protein [Penicillium verhagenii]